MKANIVKVKTFAAADETTLDAAITAFLQTLAEESFISLIPFATPTGIGAQLLYTA